MRKIKLYIATSLDGKIAGSNGSVDWLQEILNPEKTDYGYNDFYDSVDTTLMGRSTYEAILGFDVPFPYPDKTNFVFTRNKTLKDDENATYIHSDIPDFLKKLKRKEGKDIWLVGGGKLTVSLLQKKLIDELQLFIMPIAIGAGIPLFEGVKNQQMFQLIESFSYPNGVQMLRYAPQN